jgi:hypothetical protein
MNEQRMNQSINHSISESINQSTMHHIIFIQIYKRNVPSLTYLTAQNFKNVYMNNTHNSKPYSVFKFSI